MRPALASPSSLLLLLCLFFAALEPLLAQQITSLPGLNFPITFNQYSGYVEVNTTYGRNLFYWLVEAQTNASSAPLVVWFSGGPGCSSLLALTSENGPFYVNPDGATLSPNPNSWNGVANMLYVESPAGVGFSYSQDPAGLPTNDAQTATDAFNFLSIWITLYPQYKGRTLYLSGESYAGHYVPQLAAKMLASPNAALNLKGFIIGNPATDSVIDSAYVPDYVYNHALISAETYAYVQQACYNASHSLTSHVHRTYSAFGPIGEGISFSAKACNAAQMAMYKEMTMNIDGNDIYAGCPMGPDMGCENFTAMSNYLNLPAVQAAINVKIPGAWEGCSFTLNYTQSESVLSLYPALLRTLRVAIYSGDVTYNIPFLGTVAWTAEVGGAIVRPWRHWMQSKAWLGGYSVKYANNLTFVTVRGAGHMVPLYQPAAAFAVFSNFIANTL